MKGKWHSADVSFVVARRRVGAELLNLVALYGQGILTLGQGRYFVQDLFPTRAAFRAAVYRLKKAGLLVSEERDGAKRLSVTEPGRAALNVIYRPDKLWRTEWAEHWYLFIYDVPETEREYRNVLRHFLKSQRMGCLQKSVYVTPRDARPAFADLCDGADVADYAYLFRSETVLGMDPMQIVNEAWPWSKLRAQQQMYLDTYMPKLDDLAAHAEPEGGLPALAREELLSYEAVMADDPLLPRDLLPQDYLGGAVFGAHQAFVAALKALL